MRENRGSWYLLTGVVLGLGLGLLYSWVVSPIRYVDTAPKSLRSEFQDQYRALIAAAYLSSGDLTRAKARLDLLNDPDMSRTLAIQAQRALAEGRPETEIRALGLLAVALAQGFTPQPVASSPTVALPAPQSVLTGSPTSSAPVTASIQPPPVTGTTQPAPASQVPAATLVTRTPTITPLPTRTPTPTPGVPFEAQEVTLVCDPSLEQPLIQVQAQDAAGQPVPGLEVIVVWQGGEDHFFTGLKPEIGLGYADFNMTIGTIYTLRLAEGSQPVSDLTPVECEQEGGGRFWGSWLVIFVQP